MPLDHYNVVFPKPLPRPKKSPVEKRWESQKGKIARMLWKAITAKRIRDVKGVCEIGVPDICITVASHGHHKEPRSQGGKNVYENCCACCYSCHAFTHQNGKWARDNGWIL